VADKFVVDFDAFRFYEDGTESGSSPIAAQDTNVTGRNVDSDSQIHLRCRVQETGAGSVGGASTDDYQLQWRKNGGGSWTDVTASSLNAKADTASQLTDGSATTNRATDGISDGTGSFIAGEQEEGDGEIEDFEHTADNFAEHVYALILVSVDLADNDFLEFRMRLNAGAMDNSVVPRVTVAKTAAVAEGLDNPIFRVKPRKWGVA